MARFLDDKVISYLILDFNKPQESKNLLLSIHKHAKHKKQITYLCNGGASDYAYEYYKNGLIDNLIIKKNGDGGGFGQTDLWRYCKTKYAFFVQVDQVLINEINEDVISYFIELLNNGFHCIDVNGDQSNRDRWTDRAHFMEVDFFNKIGDFPNGGPGLDAIPWNEEFLSIKFQENNYKIAHIEPLLFADCGKWSERQAGDGLFKHRCDTKQMWVIKTPSSKTEVYPPLSDSEWLDVLSNKWPVWGVDKIGRIPEKWSQHSFRVWPD